MKVTNQIKKGFAAMSVVIMSVHLACAAEKAYPVVPELELLITSPRVVNSERAMYPGEWSFGTLMEKNFGKENARDTVRKFLMSFNQRTIVQGKVINSRSEAYSKLIKPWMQKDGYTGKEIRDWRPNFKHAPVKLLSIVNRQDIALFASSPGDIGESKHSYYGSIHSAPTGEVRFVYCVTDQEGQPLSGGMTIILEYRASSTSSAGVVPNHNLAKKWNALSKHKTITSDYLNDLGKLTADATTAKRINSVGRISRAGAGAGNSTSPKGYFPLLRIRTNDSTLGEGREFRQFNCHTSSATIGETAATLDSSKIANSHFFEEPLLLPNLLSASLAKEFYNPESEETVALLKSLKKSSIFPLKVETKRGEFVSTLAASMLIKNQNETIFKVSRLDKKVRRHISLNSCVGCHGGETASDGFHIAPSLTKNSQALVSSFLADDSNRKHKRAMALKSQHGELARRVAIRKELIDPSILRNSNFTKLSLEGNLTAH